MNKEILMKCYSSRDIIQMLKADGWYEVACDGDHHQFKHPYKTGQKRYADWYNKKYIQTVRNYFYMKRSWYYV
jgi:hypothetical protein